MDGPVITPTDPGFHDARRVWNAQIDRRPKLIAPCASAADVASAVGFAREYRLELSVCGGAHGTTGTAVCDDGVMIDLSLLNAVTVDSAARRARVGGGALLAPFGICEIFPERARVLPPRRLARHGKVRHRYPVPRDLERIVHIFRGCHRRL